MKEDKTALSWWFPRIEAAGLPVPRTKIIKMPQAAQEDVWQAFDGKDGSGAMAEFGAHLRASAEDLGVPFFLRTDHTSGKHEWKRTCFVADPAEIAAHVFALAEFSEIAGGLMGLPWDTWVLREFLPTRPLSVCPRYGDMPVCREFRFFVDGGTVRCHHPYWPEAALEEGGCVAIDYEGLCSTLDGDALRALASAAGKACGGSWSVDILDTDRGWVITDLAEAHKSFHWEGCANG
jgi:hypothetical protein